MTEELSCPTALQSGQALHPIMLDAVLVLFKELPIKSVYKTINGEIEAYLDNRIKVVLFEELWYDSELRKKFIDTVMAPRKLDLPKSVPPKKETPRKLDLAESGSYAAKKILVEHNTLHGNTTFVTNIHTGSGTTYTNSGPSKLTLKEAVAAAAAKDPIQDLTTAAMNEDYQLARKHEGILKGKFASLLTMTSVNLIKWGDKCLTPIQEATDLLVEMSKRFSLIDAQRWIEEAIDASNPKTGPLAWFGKQEDPIYYEAMLKKTKSELSNLLIYVDESEKHVSQVIEPLRLDLLAFQVVMKHGEKDADRLRIMTNRLASLTAGLQTALGFIQTCKNTRTQVTHQIQQIDHLFDVTIPHWKIAHASRGRK